MSSYSWKKNAQCKADEQFHFANKKWEVTKNNNNKNEKQEKTKKEKRKKQTNYSNKTQKYEQSLENSQNKIVEKTKQC